MTVNKRIRNAFCALVISFIPFSMGIADEINQFQGATQSTTGFGGIASRAIDSNTSGQWSAKSVSATTLQEQPWWTLDLGNIASIDSVTLWNRTDCCSSRLSDFYLLVSDSPFASGSLAASLADTSVKSVHFPGTASTSESISVNQTGRYIRVQLNNSNILSLAEVQVFGTLQSEINQFQGATQSTTGFGGIASRAIDSNTSGQWSAKSVSATTFQAQPWWTLDLGNIASIGSVTLWNRTDCCSSRLSDFYLLVSDSPFASGSLTTSLADPNVESFHFPGTASTSESISVNQTGRYIRVQLNNSDILSLAEVQVFGTLQSEINQFQGATQSTTGFGGIASRAIDSNTSGQWSAQSVSATTLQEQPWWTLDLGNIASIDSVTLWNRTDCCSSRLSDFYLLVSDFPFSSGSLATSLADPNVESFHFPGTASISESISVNQTGRYIRVQLNSSNILSLAEVQVFGTSQNSNPAPDLDLSKYVLAFSDEFDGAALNPNKWDTALLWGPYLPINNEEQLYVDKLGMHADFSHNPFTFTGDTLKITATATSPSLLPPPRPESDSPLWHPYPYAEYNQNRTVGQPGDENYVRGYQEEDVNYLSGIITSYGTLKMTHGYVEMRAKLPAGRGLWPAFWLLPSHYVKDVPEIDVMEFLGQDVDRVYHSYHYFDIPNNWTKISTPSYTTLSTNWTNDFHTFGMAWSPTNIVWYVDGVETQRISNSEYTIANQAMYLIANVAVGGSWPGAPDASTVFPATLEIDYIRAYKKKLNPQLDLANDYQLMFGDDFNGNTLDANKWNTHFLWGPYLPINNEEQYYVDANGSDSQGPSPFSLSNGVLSINARAADDPAGFPIPQDPPGENDPIWTTYPTFQKNANYSPPNYTSGIITSYDSFKFAHGYAEMRAKIPKGDGLWPAFWLLNGYYISQQPEIDIMEVRGENPHQIVHSYHYHENGLQSTSYMTDNGEPINGYADGFHTYGVRWQPGKIDWYIDGSVVHTYQSEKAPYQVMYVIANLAVGGDFNFSPVDPTLFPTKLEIDYIRVYQEKGIE